MLLNEIAEINEYFKHSLYEMSNYSSNATGLPSGTGLWVRTEPTELPHTKYRVKIEHPQKGGAVFALWGDEIQQVAGEWKVTGKDLKKIQTLISLTGRDLIKHINGEIDSAQLGTAFATVKNDIDRI